MSSPPRVPPPCTLEECLTDFTQVEQVQDVECGNCTLQKHLTEWQEEVELLRGAVESLERKRKTKQPPPDSRSKSNRGGADNHDRLDGMRSELKDAERKWRYLLSKQQDPDEYDPRMISSSLWPSYDDGGTEEPLTMLRSPALKCLVLTRLPSVLCLHAQRRCYDPTTDRMSKTTQHILFDEVLDLAPFCAFGGNVNAWSFFASRKDGSRTTATTGGHAPQNGITKEGRQHKPILYRLTSVIEHQGNAFGGHYVCYRRLPTTSTGSLAGTANHHNSSSWYYCSDNVVQEVPWSRVRQAQAYMLFYEAI